MYHHFIFDIDGTLMDSDRAVFESLRIATDQYGLPEIPQEVIKKHCGLPGLVFLRTIQLPHAEECFRVWCDQLAALRHLVTVYPGIPELLDQFKEAGILMGVVTSRTQDVTLPDLEAHGLLRYFEQVICSDQVSRAKPAPDPLLRYARLSAAALTDCLYIGDTSSDSVCAKAAGMDFALATWGTRESVPAQYFPGIPEDLAALAGL